MNWIEALSSCSWMVLRSVDRSVLFYQNNHITLLHETKYFQDKFNLSQYDDINKGVITVDDTTVKNAKEAIDYLASKGLISNADYWKEKVSEAMPVWAYMIVEARKAGMKV